MTIKEWLFRLGLEVLIPGFLSQHIRRVIDLKGISKGELVKMGVIKLGDQARILNMLKGDENTKKSFKLMSHQSIKALLGLSLKHLNEKKIIELVDMLPDQKITEFLLSDTLENKENYSKTIEEKIKGLVIRIEDFYNAKFLKKKENVKKYPKENPIELLERMKMGKYIEKFKENDVLEKEFFFSLDMGNLNEIGVNNIKARLSLLNEIKILKEECLEEEEITLTENNILKKSSSIQY